MMKHVVLLVLLVLVHQQEPPLAHAKLDICPLWVFMTRVKGKEPLKDGEPCARSYDCARGLECAPSMVPADMGISICQVPQNRLADLPIRARLRMYLKDIIMEDIVGSAYDFFSSVRQKQQQAIAAVKKNKQ